MEKNNLIEAMNFQDVKNVNGGSIKQSLLGVIIDAIKGNFTFKL